MLVACTAVMLISVDKVFGQQRNTFGAGQRNRPTVSPYLSMVDTTGNGPSDGGTGLNYFNIVRPTKQGRAANKRLQNELQGVESSISSLPRRGGTDSWSNGLGSMAITTGRMSETGHEAGFNDLGGRFGGGGGTRQGGGGGGQRGNTFGSSPGQGPSPGLGIINNAFRGKSTPNGILGGR
jgi:hypothetical protein